MIRTGRTAVAVAPASVRTRTAAPARELPGVPAAPRAALRTAPGDLAALRRRFAGATAREAVVVDFLEDDLRETEAAMGEIAGWLDAVLDVLADPSLPGDRIAAVAAREPADAAEALAVALASVRRRVAQVAAGVARAEAIRR